MKCHNVDVIEVQLVKDYIVRLTFDDGTSGEVDISKIISFEGVFKPLNDREFFSKVTVNSDIGTITWENGADISPSYLREKIINQK
ncbi:MAG: hypothetical protein A3F14_04955 [Gammaproteobacteria bacterium RIFCSPHIGHO2_12_FULL_43_28]|nr:MAG: hypothetical protein A3F14_04955 [Gammaproteobacteria bacterium RIFCSPHIGHO2_12_FULL_43_28]